MSVRFRVVSSRYRETPPRRPMRPSAVAKRHALGKARMAILPRGDGWTLGADTLIYFDKRIIGKPRTMREAERMLTNFSGRRHDVYTAIALVNAGTGAARVWWVRTRVWFLALDRRAIRRYLARVNPLDKAGAYAIQDGRDLVRKIQGSYTNVMGLPVERLSRELTKIGVTRTQGIK